MSDILSHKRLKEYAEALLEIVKEKKFHKPLFVAHGYGGLICEQVRFRISSTQNITALLLNFGTFKALVLSKEREKIESSEIILFGTPHFRAGLAQWALLSATRMNIPCAKTVQLQDWSPFKDDMNLLVQMQKAFRDSESPPPTTIACFFEELPVPGSNLVGRSLLMEQSSLETLADLTLEDIP